MKFSWREGTDVLKEFSISIKAPTMEKAQEELHERTSEILEAVGDGDWECMEDSVTPDPAWVPGIGFYGENRGYKGYRRFVNRAGEREQEDAKESVQQGG